MLFARRSFHATGAARNDKALLARRINALLPQTQCEQCGEPGCLPYATAVAAGADCNKCLPGGERTARSLAQLLGRIYLPPAVPAPPASVARIRAADCIGCARCLPACPVDAIVGANKYMHAILLEECTGCGLCVAPCPVDCIDIVALTNRDPDPSDAEARRRAANAGQRYAQHEHRRADAAQTQASRRAERMAQHRAPPSEGS